MLTWARYQEKGKFLCFCHQEFRDLSGKWHYSLQSACLIIRKISLYFHRKEWVAILQQISSKRLQNSKFRGVMLLHRFPLQRKPAGDPAGRNRIRWKSEISAWGREGGTGDSQNLAKRWNRWRRLTRSTSSWYGWNAGRHGRLRFWKWASTRSNSSVYLNTEANSYSKYQAGD